MKRVAIARALINGPSLIIADEPTGDLDVDTEFEIMELFRDLNREGKTIIMVTHNPDLVQYATKTYGMDRGKLIKSFDPFSTRKLSGGGVHYRPGIGHEPEDGLPHLHHCQYTA